MSSPIEGFDEDIIITEALPRIGATSVSSRISDLAKISVRRVFLDIMNFFLGNFDRAESADKEESTIPDLFISLLILACNMHDSIFT